MAQEHPHQATLGEYGEFSIQGYHQAAAAAAGGGGGGHELYSLQSRMEMLELPAKHHHQHPSHHNSEASWGFHHLHHHHHHHHNPETSSSSFVDDSLRCLFPVHEEGEEQPSQGLSLSLYNPDPSVADYQRSILFSRQGSSNSTVSLHQGVSFHGEAAAASTYHKLRLSKYLIPAQELLNEFCFLGGGPKAAVLKQNQKSRRTEEGASPVSSHSSLHSLDILELQKRKAKLLNLLEEVDRRYRRYCEQMRAVVSSFEAVAGEGAATAYLALASRAMSRHFRTLRDGIANQVQAAKKAVGEKDSIAPGISRGETPRLKVLDQCFRQHKAFQHGAGGMLPDNHPWRPQRGLPERSVSILRAWLFEHFLHPYPSDVDKHILARQTGLSRSQVSNWFINARVRLWKPMIEEMYTEELKEHELQSCTAARGQQDDPSCSRDHAATAAEDQKPLPARLLAEPDSLSSVVNQRSEPRSHHSNPLQRAENYGIADIDFSSYGGCGGGGAVSLTLGLHHPDGGAMGFSVTPASQEPPPLFYTRGQMEEYQPVQFSLLDGEVQNLPYRNLMGAQLLHDLAG